MIVSATNEIQTMAGPTGTVTFLFSDIAGSAAHWEERLAAMAQALRRHDELLRGAIETNGGYVFKTIGDAFCAAFSRPSEAIASALAAQRAIAAEDWSAVNGLAVRMAVHSGAADERDGDYFGPPVNRVARLLAIAHGGQTIVSSVTAHLLRGAMPEGSELRDVGEHRLKDLTEPERVWQLTAPGLADTFPPLLSLASLPNNLPRQLTPLIGRDEVLRQIEQLVSLHPLVTLVGTGGVGKTRAALQAGADLLDGSADGVWLVELAPVSDPDLVAGAIAAALGVRDHPERPALSAILHYLKARRLLLLLDNCEHLIAEVANVADAILHGAPDVRVLATSREPLRIDGERVYRMPSLDVPAESTSLAANDALQYGAVALFVRRAAASESRFTLTSENAPVVAGICRRLDGIALAIELAAARVKVLSPHQLAEKLDERFRVLSGGSRTAMPRQQTMRAAIEWSYDLLSRAEQRLFARIAIFVGGWTLEAAETVTGDRSLDARDVLELLASLADKSLVVAELNESASRYRLLESTRAFALEKLEEGGDRSALERRHAAWAAELADRVGEAYLTAPTTQLLAKFEPEIENVRAAIDWAVSNGDAVTVARAASGFVGIWRARRGVAQVRRWLEDALPQLDEESEPAIAARNWHALASVTNGQRRVEAAQRALALSERSDDPIAVIRSLDWLSSGLYQTGRIDEAQLANDRALRICRDQGLTRSGLYARALNVRGAIATGGGRLESARVDFAEAIALSDALGDELSATVTRLNMSEIEFQAGNTKRALDVLEKASSAARAMSMEYRWSALVNAAAYRIVLNDIAGARDAAREALRGSRAAFPTLATAAMQHLATVEALSGSPRQGARLLGYVNASYGGARYEREFTERRTYEILMAALHDTLDDGEIESLAVEGARLTEEQAVAEALAYSAT